MGNKAAEELANLAQATQQADDQAAHMAAQDREAGANGARRLYDPDGDGKASLALPEGLATAVAAGFILGPAGGLAMGLAQAWLGKQERQNILDQWAAENDTWDNVEGVLNGRLDSLVETATNKNDLEQLQAFRAQQDAGLKLVRSANPNMQQRGAAMLADIDSQVNAYTERQETQRIEQEAIDAELKRVLGEQEFERYSTARDEYNLDLDTYEARMDNTNRLFTALSGTDPASQQAAAVLFRKTLDETSAVLPGEEASSGGTQSWLDSLARYVQTIADGGTLSPTQRADMGGIMGKFQELERSRFLRVEARYKTRLNNEGVEDPKLLEQFNASSQVKLLAPPAIARADAFDQMADSAESLGQQVGLGTDVQEAESGAGSWWDNYKKKLEEYEKNRQPGIWQPGGWWERTFGDTNE